jgi:transposase
MPTQDYWAPAPWNRQQHALFAPTLDATIGDDDSVRLLDEVLAGMDWYEWEAEYDGTRGQPPIHPRFVAACLLYGLCRGIRSSRKLEEACIYRIDFMWLLEGRHIDHSTLAKFRTHFGGPLKKLFRQLCRIAMTLGLVRLGEVAFDGTRVKANNSRYKTRTASTLEQKLEALDALFEEMLAECQAVDQQTTLDPDELETRLPPELAKIDDRRQQVREALAKARAADAARRQQGIDPAKNPAQVPTTDSESRVMPNKEGGYAPNYTPTAITDGHRGFIVDADVTAEVNEGHVLVESVDRIAETCGELPDKLLTDGGNNGGHLLEALEQRGIEVYAPVESNQPQPGNPARRDDPTQPVAECEWPQLPRNNQGQLDKSCFVYDAEHDQYFCPQGHAMPFEKTKTVKRGGEPATLRIYRCGACASCPLADVCLGPSSKVGRTVSRDPYEVTRERVAARMATQAARKQYNQRPRIAETTFGILKSVMGVRQFLLRGLRKVRMEWTWATTAFNLRKLVGELVRLRAKLTALVMTPVS